MDRSLTRIAWLAAAALASGALGVSSASAIPRTSKAEFNAQEDLRNLAIDEEIYLTDVGTRYATFSQLAQDHVSVTRHSGVVLRIVHIETNLGYCLEATTGMHHFVYDSAAGGLSDGARCIMTTQGPGGGTLGRSSASGKPGKSQSGHGKPGSGKGNLVPPPRAVRAER
jgi:hypothetical protein